MKKLFELPPLPYAYDALQPAISEETLRLHHDRHHAGYVKVLNELLLQTNEYDRSSLDQMILTATGEIYNQAAQNWNHTFYWNSMTSKPKPLDEGKFRHEVIRTFGSIERFKEDFFSIGKVHFGSGWVWLVLDTKRSLHILSTHDAGNPMRMDCVPLLVCDLWEHAYYVDYRNEREKYLEAFWSRINWEFAEKNLILRFGR